MHKFSMMLASRPKKKSRYDEEGIDGYDWYEGQTRWPITRIIKVVFCTISAIVWAIILFRIFSSGNAEFEKMILLDDRASLIYSGQQKQVVRIFSATEEQIDGSIMIYYPVYLPETDNLQFTARVNRKAFPPATGETGYTFVLRESGSEETRYYPLSYYKQEKRFQYTFFRLCFDGVELQEDRVYTFLAFSGDYVSQDESNPYPVTSSRFHFTLCNTDTYRKEITPNSDVFELAS